MDATREPTCAENPESTRLFADTDWSTTPLGPTASWPPELAMLARLVLRAKSPQHLVWGPQQILIYNDGYIPLLGDRHPAAFGRCFRDVWPDIWHAVEPTVHQTYAGVSSFHENHPFELDRGGCGEKIWVSFAYTPVEGADGEVQGFHCNFHDTTATVLAEHERAERTSRMRELWDQAPGFVAVTRGPRHAYELCNRAYLRFVGDRPLLGLPVEEAIPELDPRFIALLDGVYASGEPFVGQRIAVGLQRTAKGPVEDRVVDFIFQPVREDDGSVGGIFIQGTDITEQHAAEQAAEAERARLRALLDALPIGIAYADASGELQTVNRALHDVWGDFPASASVDEYAEWKGWWPAQHPRAGMRLESGDWPMARALTGEHVRGELVDMSAFGSAERRTLMLHSAPVRNASGAIIGAVTAQQDISDRVLAEAALRESEAKFRTIADAMPQMVWSTRPDGLHDFFNAQWYEFTGTAPGSTDGDGWTGVFHPEDQPRAEALWQRSLATGEPYEIEYRLRHRGGEYRWVLGRALPVRDDAGGIIRWMGTCTDIHEQKLAREALADSEARFRAVADNIPQLAWMTDADGAITWYNDRWYAYTGTTPEQMEGWGWRGVHPPAHVDRVVAEVRACFDAGQPWQDTYLLRGADGDYRWFLTQVVPLRDVEGRITRWFGTNTDVTAQREAEDALRLADRRKDEFLAMLSHELRNPLAPIRTASDVIGMPATTLELARHAGQVIGRQVEHMTRLVDDLLDVSRVTRGHVDLDLQPFDLREAVRAAVEQVRPLAEARAHALAIRMDAAPLWVNGERTRLTQVVANLLNNAVKYTPPGGSIHVDARALASRLQVSVRDTGIGIDAALLPHVFELFTQGSRTLDRSQGGLGIGLALVRALAELHGGSVQASSEGAGHGSCFVLDLPACAPPVATAAAVAPAGRQATALRVGVVDDNRDAARTLGCLLEAAGHAVSVFETGEDALAGIGADTMDAWVLDIGLPGIDGLELARRLRARDGAAPVLFALSGYGREEDRLASRQAGFAAHLVKPTDGESLLEVLESHVRDRLRAAHGQPVA